MQGNAEKIYILVHRCHEQCLKLMHTNNLPARQYSDIGINTRQGVILKLLLDEGEMTQKELTQRLQITSSSCGELIGKLEQGGYLEKHVSPADKRTFDVSLTQSGRVLAAQYKETCIIELEEWASDLLAQEKETLLHLLGKLSQGLDDRINRDNTQTEG